MMAVGGRLPVQQQQGAPRRRLPPRRPRGSRTLLRLFHNPPPQPGHPGQAHSAPRRRPLSRLLHHHHNRVYLPLLLRYPHYNHPLLSPQLRRRSGRAYTLYICAHGQCTIDSPPARSHYWKTWMSSPAIASGSADASVPKHPTLTDLADCPAPVSVALQAQGTRFRNATWRKHGRFVKKSFVLLHEPGYSEINYLKINCFAMLSVINVLKIDCFAIVFFATQKII